VVQRRLDGANHVSNTCMCKEAERGHRCAQYMAILSNGGRRAAPPV
jgi:hypothetical protein